MSTRIEKQIEEAKQYVETLQILAAQGDSQMTNDLIALADKLAKYKICITDIINGFRQNSWIDRTYTGEFYYRAWARINCADTSPKQLLNLKSVITHTIQRHHTAPNLKVGHYESKFSTTNTLDFEYSLKVKL